MPMPDLPEYRAYVGSNAAMHSFLANARMYRASAAALAYVPWWNIFARWYWKAEMERYARWSINMFEDAIKVDRID